MDLNIEEKLQILFDRFYGTDLSSYIEDDTVLQKLKTSLDEYIRKKENLLVWSEEIGMLRFISESLNERYVSARKDTHSVTIAFALHCLGSLVQKEEDFCTLSSQMVILSFKQGIPHFQESMSLNANALKVAESLVHHKTGLMWIVSNGIWENLLISSLKIQNIFVQRACVTVITNLLLNIQDDKILANYILDMELILTKFRESKSQLKQVLERNEETNKDILISSTERLQFNIDTVMLILHSILFETLGRRSMYMELRQLINLTSLILFEMDFQKSSVTLIKYSKILLLGVFHKMQEKVLKSGNANHLDSFDSDVLDLIRNMIHKGYGKEFLVASFEVHRFWEALCKNMDASSRGQISRCESIVFLFLKLQITPLLMLCSASLSAESNSYWKVFQEDRIKWEKEFEEKMAIKDDQKLEMNRLVELLKENLTYELKSLENQSVSHLSHFSSVIPYLQPSCASLLFQICILVLKFKIDQTLHLECNPRFYLNMTSVLRSLAESFRIENCDFRYFMPAICHVIWIPGITSRVKVSTLQLLSIYLVKFSSSTTASSHEVPDTKMKRNEAFDKLRATLTLTLSDVDWEVRDSVLEFILSCVSVQTKQGPPFDEWFLRFRLLEHVLQAVGDVEPYVQATAIAILAIVVGVPEIWSRLEGRNIKHLALRAVVRSGETCIRKTGLQLLRSLIAKSKFEGDEINRFVIPVAQAVTTDSDDELRVAALRVIRQHLDTELAEMGMIDGEFPTVTFHRGKITNLEENEIQNRVLSVICRFCRNGSFQSIVNCSRDSVGSVSMESNDTLNFLMQQVNKYNLASQIHCLNDCKPTMSTRRETSSPPSSREHDSVVNRRQKTEDRSEIEEVLQTPDLAALSKISKIPSSSANWWEETASEHLLEDEEIPPHEPPVTSDYFLECLKMAKNLTVAPDGGIQEAEVAIAVLLDDIFLAAGNLGDIEAKAMDCY